MSDDAPSVVAGWNVRIIFGSITLAFSMALVIYLVLKGSASNGLHESAMTGSFALIGAILLGFGVGAVAPLIASLTRK